MYQGNDNRTVLLININKTKQNILLQWLCLLKRSLQKLFLDKSVAFKIIIV
jgi:hypothetical protein